MSDTGAPTGTGGPLPADPSEPTSQPAQGTAPDATAPSDPGEVPGAEVAAGGESAVEAAPAAPEGVPDGRVAAAGEAAGVGAAEAAPAGVAAASAETPRQHRGLRGAMGRTLSRIPHPPLRSRRGLFLVAFMGGAMAVAMTVGGVVAVQWTETADFCGRCHTMAPELKAYELSVHRDVTCAECHVEPGITGWVKAKLNGTRQLVEVILGTFPQPIPAPEHGMLPSTQDTCLKCHTMTSLVANGGPVNLILNTRYAKDEPNTAQSVALVVRPNGFGDTPDANARKGVHWHIISDVEFWHEDPQAQTIDLVEVKNPDGTSEEYIARRAVEVSTDVQPDIDHVKETQSQRRMDCITCHNRAGHAIPGVDQSIDSGITAGAISQRLPWVKSQSSDLLNQEYASVEDANRAIRDGLTAYYDTNYPLVAQNNADLIDRAVRRLQATYDLVATPEMRVTADTYPNNLGHQTAPGCFRCHDGAHYKVVEGAVTDETIPSGCATCHTFPQIGSINSGVLIGQRPESHTDRLWVFNHRDSVSTVDASKTECGQCHTTTYCQNCHNTKAVQVPHSDMVFNHGNIAREVGTQTCAFCHQPAYCTQCHSDDVLPNPYPQDLSTPKPETGGSPGGDGSVPAGDPQGSAPGGTAQAGVAASGGAGSVAGAGAVAQAGAVVAPTGRSAPFLALRPLRHAAAVATP